MQVTRVSVVKIAPQDKNSRFKALVSIELDNKILIRNIRIIQDEQGNLFLAMPSTERKRRCFKCGGKMSYRYQYCPNCGHENVIIPGRANYKDIIAILDGELKKNVVDKVLEEYKKL